MAENEPRSFGYDLSNTNLFANLSNSIKENFQKPQPKKKSLLVQEYNQKRITNFTTLKNKNSERKTYIEALLEEYGKIGRASCRERV